MKPLEQGIRAVFARRPQLLYGFSTAEAALSEKTYRCALVFAAPYFGQLTLENYTESLFEAGIQGAKREIEDTLRELEALLKSLDAGYWIPPAVQRDEAELLAPFSYKYAAWRAGLGWMGRNDTLITPSYGPRVRLSALLLEEALPCRAPLLQSRCPTDCGLCVEACPCGALTGETWTPDSRRADLVDYHRCNRYRSAYREALGRKHACGRCMAACPAGIRVVPVTEENEEEILSLRVAEDQRGYIETTAQCLEEARALPLWRPVGILADGRLVGFAMYGLWKDEGDGGRVWLDRFLIDARFQGRGFGRAALPVLIGRIFREYGQEALYLSLVPENRAAARLYQSVGFQFNGETDPKGERVMVLRLHSGRESK